MWRMAELVEELLARIEALEAERAILRTIFACAAAIDAGDEEAFVACFTVDGEFEASGASRDATTFRIRGEAELAEFLAGHTRPPERRHRHVVAEPIVEVEGDEATCRSYFMVVVEHEGEPVLRTFGRYEDRLRREGDGTWRLQRRSAELDSLRPGLPPLAYGRGASGGG